MAFLEFLKAQVNNVNMSIGELVKDTPYPVKSMKNVDTKFETTVTCILRNPVGSGTINIFLPKPFVALRNTPSQDFPENNRQVSSA
ncbi:hypothetical protein QTP88_025093 [Uroleucon formosanum]